MPPFDPVGPFGDHDAHLLFIPPAIRDFPLRGQLNVFGVFVVATVVLLHKWHKSLVPHDDPQSRLLFRAQTLLECFNVINESLKACVRRAAADEKTLAFNVTGEVRPWLAQGIGFFLDRGTPTLSVHRLEVTYTDGAVDTYLVPLSWRDHVVEELSSAFIGALPYEGREVYAYDAMRDRDATVPWLTHLVNASTIGPMHFHPAGVDHIPEGLPGDIVSGEQSNTSLIFGQEAIL